MIQPFLVKFLEVSLLLYLAFTACPFLILYYFTT